MRWWKTVTGWIETNHKWLEIALTLAAIVVAYCLLHKTGEQVDIARDSSQKELRGYMAAIEPRLLSWTVGDLLRATHVEGNLGNTPAFDVCANKRLEIRAKDSVPNPLTLAVFSAPIVVGAHTQTTYRDNSDLAVTREDSIGFRTGRLRIYFYGKITYTDIFHREQWLTFCFEYYFEAREFQAYRMYNDGSRE